MTRFTVHSITNHGVLGLAFELQDRLVCIGEAEELPDVTVQAFDLKRDIYYTAPAPLNPTELEAETLIHVPESLRNQIDRRVLASTFGTSVLMQFTEKLSPAISPLSALRVLLEPLDGVNTALLEANNGAMIWSQRAAEQSECNIAAVSLGDFIATTQNRRKKFLPNFGAETIVVSGSDVDHFEGFDFGEMIEARRIELLDFESVCDFTEKARTHVGESPNYFTLAIGAAAVYAAILRA